MSKVLIIEDEVSIAELEKDYLELSGFDVEIESDGARGLEKALASDFDMYILDLMLPGMDGFEICKRIREVKNTPILMVSAKKDDIDKIRGLGLGADDYIEKPYDIDILLAKIKGIFKRRYQRSILSVNGVTLNLADRTAEIDGKPVELPAKEFDLLQLLMENQGKALKKEYLFNTVWGSDSNSELQTLHVHINRLRQKLGDDPKNAKRLITVWGVGYKFV